MKITAARILLLSIPMRQVVHHALASRTTARNVFVVLTDESGVEGWGECCPRPYVTGETVESAVQDIQNIFIPALTDRSYDGWLEVCNRLDNIGRGVARNQLAAFCAVELAALDLAGKLYHTSAGQVIGEIQHQQVFYSGVIAAESLDDLEKQAHFMARMKVRQVKIKTVADFEHNLNLLKAARSILGDAVELRIDANCAWNSSEAVRQLERFRDFRLAGVEQPVPGDDLAGLREITAADLVPVVVDESLCSIQDAESLIQQNACHVFNVRVSKCGGLLNTRRIYQIARDAGLECQLGAQVGESGILSAAGRHLATRLPDLKWLEGSYGSMLLENDITEPDITVGVQGIASALDGNGMGVTPDRELVNRYLDHSI
jgi:L-alanine-DL-glutamate epimerase-like enolase superfamily enzyme